LSFSYRMGFQCLHSFHFFIVGVDFCGVRKGCMTGTIDMGLKDPQSV
jgi:hypothetical protein